MTARLVPIAGGDSDFLTAHHLLLEGSNREIGRELAHLAKAVHRAELATCCDPLRIQTQRKHLRQGFPLLYDRMLGVAEAYDRSPDDTSVDLTNLFAFDLDIYSEFFSCSSAYVPASHLSESGGIVLRNMDEGVRTAGEQTRRLFGHPYVLEMYPDEGFPSLMMVAIDLLSALDGINSEGLVVTYAAHADYRMTKDHSWEPTMHSEPGLNELQVIRHLLDTCATTAQAKEALLSMRRYYWFEPMLYLVSDRHGESFICETSKSGNLTFFRDGQAEPQVMTNFGFQRFASLEEIPESDDMQTGLSFTRYQTIKNGLTDTGLTLHDLKGLMAQASFDQLCPTQPDASELMRTVWTSIYDIDSRSVEVSFYLGEDSEGQGTRRSDYVQFALR
ncbi:C45 family autoproteolytic acyltransferase/hydrolase [Candidatus Bipolaricaulota bacterium]